MKTKELKVYAQIQALVIQAKGMESLNQSYVMGGREPVWGEEHFYEISEEIRTLANSLDQTQDTPQEDIKEEAYQAYWKACDDNMSTRWDDDFDDIVRENFEIYWAKSLQDKTKTSGVTQDAPVQPIQYDTNVKTEDPC